MFGILILCETTGVNGYCTFSVVDEWPVCSVVLQVCVDFDEVVSCVHDTDTCTFITWFDDNEFIILETVQCCFFPLMLGYCKLSDIGC